MNIYFERCYLSSFDTVKELNWQSKGLLACRDW
jgi:hypothetical protein